MNKTEIIQQLAKTTGFERVAAEAFVEAYTALIIDTVQKGENFTIMGLGVFKPSVRAARMARDLKRNVMISVPEKRGVRFTVSPKFKALLNPQEEQKP